MMFYKFCGIKVLCSDICVPFIFNVSNIHIRHISMVGLKCKPFINRNNFNRLHRQTVGQIKDIFVGQSYSIDNEGIAPEFNINALGPSGCINTS